MEIKYSNLTQNPDGNRLVYIRSSWVECRNWKGLLWSVPDEMLYHLARGDRVEIIDASKHKKGKIERIFVPVLKRFLEEIWLGKHQKFNIKTHLDDAFLAYRSDSSLRARYHFWKELTEGLNEIKLSGSTVKLNRESSKIEFLSKIGRKSKC